MNELHFNVLFFLNELISRTQKNCHWQKNKKPSAVQAKQSKPNSQKPSWQQNPVFNFLLGSNQVMENPVLLFAEWCIVGGCFPQIADHLVFFSALFLTRWVDLGTAGLFVPLCGKVFTAISKQLPFPEANWVWRRAFVSPLSFMTLNSSRLSKSGGSWVGLWMPLNDRAEAEAAMHPLIGRKWEVFAFHHINSSQQIRVRKTVDPCHLLFKARWLYWVSHGQITMILLLTKLFCPGFWFF